jgi:putative intracellular protease/amidase
MAKELKGRRFAMVATDRFEQSELTEPREALKRAGAVVDIVRQRPVISKACSTTKRGNGGGRSHGRGGGVGRVCWTSSAGGRQPGGAAF